MKLTLDTNCIIDLEQNNSIALPLQNLISLNNNQKINLRVTAISASERKLGGTYAANFAEFQQKIAAVGLGNVEILAPIAYSGITFVERCVSADETMIELERKIQEVLFPTIDFDYEIHDDNEDMRRRNAKCDVLALWCHITYDGDIFVTSDRNFFKKTKKPHLIALGARAILTPQASVAKLEAMDKN